MINTGDGCSKLAKGLPIVQGSMWFATCLPLSVCWHIWATRTPNCNWGSSLLVKLLKSKQTAYPCPFENKTEMHPPFHRYSQIYRHQDCIICFPNQNFTSGKEKKAIALMCIWNTIFTPQPLQPLSACIIWSQKWIRLGQRNMRYQKITAEKKKPSN